VLRDYPSQQVFVFTDRKQALEHFRGWGATIHDLCDPLRSIAAPLPAPSTASIEPDRSDSSARRIDALQTSDPVERFPALGPETREALEPANIRTVGDLLVADPTRVARRVSRRQVTPAVVALWQSHAGLMCFVPSITLDDAQILTSIGIHCEHDLAEENASDVCQRIEAYLESDRGRRFADRGYALSQRMVRRWIAAANRPASQRGDDSIRADWLRRSAERRKLTRVEARDQEEKHTFRIKRELPKRKRTAQATRDEPSKRRRPGNKQPPKIKFHLELTSTVNEAPSISGEIAEQLSAAGIRQVRDLLAADAEKLAVRLNGRDIAAVEIVAWQHQARLCCRIPNLHASEAAVLVGAGFSTPEDVASMKPAELHSFIVSFAKTSDGRLLLGDAGPPDLATVEGWIRAARHSRALGAA
jgi:hypothetical protein